MQKLLVLVALALAALSLQAQPATCQGVCAGSTCITHGECGSVTCFCAHPGPGPEGFCAVKQR